VGERREMRRNQIKTSVTVMMLYVLYIYACYDTSD
jgi:hypothetical protein